MELVLFQILVGAITCFGLILWTLLPVLLSQRTRARSLTKRQQQRVQSGIILANCFACGVFLSTCFYGMVPHARKHLIEAAAGYGVLPGGDPGAVSAHKLHRREETGHVMLPPTKSLLDVSSHHKANETDSNLSHEHSAAKATEPRSANPGDETWKGVFEYLVDKPTTEILIMIGFLLTILIEELVHLCQARCCKTSKKHGDCCRSAYDPVNDGSVALTVKPSARHAHQPNSSHRAAGGGEDVIFDRNISLTSAAIPSNGSLPSIKQRPNSKLAEHEPLVDLNDGSDDDEDLWGSPVIQSDNVELSSPHHHDHDHHAHEAGVLGNHGHHHHMPNLSPSDESLSFRSMALLFGLGVHNIFEGLALGLQTSQEMFVNVLIGILVHELLCALAFGISLAEQRIRLGTGISAVITYISCIPFGMVIGVALETGKSPPAVLAQLALEGISTGTFIYVACVELFAAEFGHHSHGSEPGGTQDHPEDGHHHHSGPAGLVKVLFAGLGCACFVLIASTMAPMG